MGKAAYKGVSPSEYYMHDGKIWVTSEGEGNGITFAFIIPIQ